MKKLLWIIAGMAVLAVGSYIYIFDAKDNCLDYGGSYNETTKQCEK